MNCIVCIKRVVDTAARIRIADDGRSVDESGVKFVMAPYDEIAVEAALRIREEAGEGDVTVVSIGGDGTPETLRNALAMGADRAVHLTGRTGMDGLATAGALARELEDEDAALIFFGVKATDDDQEQVGPMVATLLGRPCAAGVAEFEIEDGVAVCRREVEGGVEVVELDLPAVITMTKGPYEPRYASLKGIMAAKKKPMEERPADLDDPRLAVRSLDEPPERPPGKIVGEDADAVPELVDLLRNEAQVL